MTLHQQMTHYCACGQTASPSVATILDWCVTSVDPCPLLHSPFDNMTPFLIPIHTAHEHMHVFVRQASDWMGLAFLPGCLVICPPLPVYTWQVFVICWPGRVGISGCCIEEQQTNASFILVEYFISFSISHTSHCFFFWRKVGLIGWLGEGGVVVVLLEKGVEREKGKENP
jgi:hypothetical protein